MEVLDDMTDEEEGGLEKMMKDKRITKKKRKSKKNKTIRKTSTESK